jgi:site-specific DNA recombinase
MSTQQAVIYARVSSREQEQEGYSIDAQLKLARSFASKNGFEIVQEFVDIESAKSAGRQGHARYQDSSSKSRDCKVRV